MNLHADKASFLDLCKATSAWKHLPSTAIERDYYIVLALSRLAESEFADEAVFKGGTSLSKCYPGSIERFSEDIDLTYLGMDEDDKTCSKKIKSILKVMGQDAKEIRKIPGEGNARNHSRLLIYGDDVKGIKLEIGCTVKPDPFYKKEVKTYIQEYLENSGMENVILSYGFSPIAVNALAIERTFIDKVMAVKRHAICGNLPDKARHIYDVVRLNKMEEIKLFLGKKDELKTILQKVKETDSFYLAKRRLDVAYDSRGQYSFSSWRTEFETEEVKSHYDQLPKKLLYSDEVICFEDAVKTFENLDGIFKEIGE